MSVLRRAKLRTPDGIESIEYPLGVEAENVEVTNGENLSQRLVRIDEDLIKNKEDITTVNEIAVINRQNIGAAEERIDALERRDIFAENVEVANGENLSQRLARIDEDLENNEEDIAAVGELAGTNKQNIGAAEVRIDALEKKNNYTVSSLKTDALIIRGTDGNYYKIIYNTTTSALEVIRA